MGRCGVAETAGAEEAFAGRAERRCLDDTLAGRRPQYRQAQKC